jgi:hypothetical protein
VRNSQALDTPALCSSDQDLLKPAGLRTPVARYPGSHQSLHTPHSAPEATVPSRLAGERSGALGREEVQPGGPQGTIKRGRFKVKRVPSGAQEDGFLRSKRSNLKRSNLRHMKDIIVALKVTVYNISPMLPINRELAEKYLVRPLTPASPMPRSWMILFRCVTITPPWQRSWAGWS